MIKGIRRNRSRWMNDCTDRRMPGRRKKQMNNAKTLSLCLLAGIISAAEGQYCRFGRPSKGKITGPVLCYLSIQNNKILDSTK